MKNKKTFCLCAMLLLAVFGISANDKLVESYNLVSQKVEEKSYSAIKEYTAKTVYFTLANGSMFESANTLPIYVEKKGWVEAKDIQVGDEVLFYAQGKVVVERVATMRVDDTEKQQFTYVNVQDNHNYFKYGVLVHNCPSKDCGTPNCQDRRKPKPDDDDNTGGGGGDSKPPPPPPPPPPCGGCGSTGSCRCEENAGDGADDVEDEAGDIEDDEGDANDELGDTEDDTVDTDETGDSGQEGDPVLVTTGKYILEETDVSIMSGLENFTIERTFIQGTGGGSLGALWSANLDSRLIRTWDSQAQGVLNKINTSLGIISSRIASIRRYVNYAPSAFSSLMKANAIYSQTVIKQNHWSERAVRAGKLNALNTYTAFGSVADFAGAGNADIVFADDGGSPVYFEYTGNGEWKPSDAEKAQYMRITSRDGRDSLSEAGFILYEKGGKETWFDKWGLIEKKLDRSKNETVYVRDAGTKYLQKIVTAEGREIQFKYTASGLLESAKTSGGEKVVYGYVGNNLRTVLDTEGDTSTYEYDGEGYLTKLIKPDGTYISFAYGLENKAREKLTTSTTNEERMAEYFEYDEANQLTIYTNHSGVTSYIYYDENHRTTREVDADGTTIEYFYDDATGNITSQTINGDRTQYSYDARGNKTRAVYSDGSTENWTYNNIDQILRYSDRDGKTQTLQYDTKGNVLAIQIGTQVVLRASYDSKGNMLTSTDYAGNLTRYEYDSFGNMIRRSIGSAIESFEYDGQNRVVVYVDAENRKLAYTYTAKTVTEIGANGLETVYTYDNRKDLVQILETDSISGEQRITKLTYDARHLLQEIVQGDKLLASYTYYPAGEMHTETIGEVGKEEYWVNEYAYDASGKVQTIQATKYSEDGIQEGSTYTESYAYAQTTQGEVRTRIAPLDRTQSYSFDRWDRVTAIENALGETSERVVSSAGRVQREQSSHGGWYEYGYDEAGRLNAVAEEGKSGVQVAYSANGTLAQKTDQEGNITRYTYNEQGLLTQESSAERNVYYSYDKVGRVTQVIVGASASISSAEQYTDYSYSTDGRTVQVTYGGKYTKIWTLNAWGETIQQEDGEGNTRSYEYNKQGQLVKALDAYGNASEYEYNSLGKVQAITYPDTTKVVYNYNNLGYMQSATDSEGIQWQGDYDDAGRLIRETGRPGINRQYTYDKLDRIKTVSIAGVLTESYEYTEKGIRVTFTDGKGADYTYTKDNFGRLVTEENRLGQSQDYTYDDKGQLEEKADFAHKTTEMDYDVARRIQTISYADGSQSVIRYNMAGQILEAIGSTGTISYTYDKAGLLETQTDEQGGETSYYTYDNAGRRTRLLSGNREISYAYGKNGELLNVEDNIQRLFVSYTYDIMMRETSRSFGNGVVQHTEYDSIGRTTLIVEKTPTREILRAEGYIYDAKGRRSHSVSETGQVTKYLYDSQGRLETVYYPYSVEKVEADKQEATEAGLFFTLDKGEPEGLYLTNAESRELKALLDDVSFGRSSLLTTMQTAWKESYTYDANSNRLTKTTPWGTVKYSYDSENRLVHSGVEGNGTNFSYDANGNLLSKQNAYKTEQYAYNGINRMAQSVVTDNIENTQTTSYYGYDAFGRRTLVQDEGFATMRTLYDGQSFDIIRENEVFGGGDFTTNYSSGIEFDTGEATGGRYRYIEDGATDGRYRNVDGYIIEKTRFTGTKATLYANGESVGVNRFSSTGESSGRAYFGTDILGSIRNATTDGASIEDRYEYDAFGTPYKGDFTTGLGNGYTGKPYDQTTGLYNYGFRDYSPQTARFTTVDPIRDGNNWFSYVVNDPVNYVDLWGLEIITTDGDFKQQDFGENEKLGNSDTESAQDAGCLVVAYSDSASAVTGNDDITPSATNADDGNFTSDKSGNMDVSTATQNDGMTHDWWTRDVQGNLNDKINEAADSPDRFGVVARVPYNDAGNQHWVTVQGGTDVREDGIEYVPVKGSSDNDYNSGSRPADWDYGTEETGDAGIIYIPVDQVEKIHTMQKSD